MPKFSAKPGSISVCSCYDCVWLWSRMVKASCYSFRLHEFERCSGLVPKAVSSWGSYRWVPGPSGWGVRRLGMILTTFCHVCCWLWKPAYINQVSPMGHLACAELWLAATLGTNWQTAYCSYLISINKLSQRVANVRVVEQEWSSGFQHWFWKDFNILKGLISTQLNGSKIEIVTLTSLKWILIYKGIIKKRSKVVRGKGAS